MDLQRPLRCVEFFAGLGGYSCALRQSGAGDAVRLPRVEVVAAYEVDRVCCDVFEHNHSQRPSNQSIETLDATTLSSHRADLWVLSPPCQPFTRGGASCATCTRIGCTFPDGLRTHARARSTAHACRV